MTLKTWKLTGTCRNEQYNNKIKDTIDEFNTTKEKIKKLEDRSKENSWNEMWGGKNMKLDKIRDVERHSVTYINSISRRIGKKQCLKWTDIWIQVDERKQCLFNRL